MVGKDDKMVTYQLLHGLHHIGAACESARNFGLKIPTLVTSSFLTNLRGCNLFLQMTSDEIW